MSMITKERNVLKMTVSNDGQDLLMDIARHSKGFHDDYQLTDVDFAKMTAEALMQYKIQLENKAEGGSTILRDKKGKEMVVPVEQVTLS